ncbi:hypothetical protein QFC19_005142 [Naganishia cerealis]|uniref:Uncharacterized protein n=1 Tax=Naganishia cerealis TaxID=610337 RepID=A0ACC2VRU8_9TREE|nr:hypothetical protein QFC19_005142 [Naganishia cerealis]
MPVLPLLLALAAAILLRYAALAVLDSARPHDAHDAATRRRHRQARILALSASISSHVPPTASAPPPSTGTAAHARAYTALRSLIARITSSFVLPWYIHLSPSPHVSGGGFPEALETVLLGLCTTLAHRLGHTNTLPDLCAARLLPKITHHFDEYRKLEHLLNPLTRHASLRTSAAVAAILQSQHAHLHPALPPATLANPLPSIEAYLRTRIVQPLLDALMQEDDKTEVVVALAREVVTCQVLLPLVDMLSEPDFWNQWISDKLDPYLQGRVGNLNEAKRLRGDIDREIRLLMVATEEGEQARGRTEERKRDEAHLVRLQKARGRIDKRIEKIAGTALTTTVPAGHASVIRTPTTKQVTTTTTTAAARVEPTFPQILENPSSLVLFTEFMDRRGQSNVIQFWLAVNSFQMPLEDHDAEDEPDDGGDDGRADNLRIADDGEIGYEDLCLLWTRFVSPKNGTTLRESISSTTPHLVPIERVVTTPKHLLLAREIVAAQRGAFRAQREAYRFMREQCWPPFRRTELFRKAAMDVEAHNRAGMYESPPTSREQVVLGGGYNGKRLREGSGPSAAEVVAVGREPSQRWMSLSTHFPSFSRPNKLGTNEPQVESASPGTHGISGGVEDDDSQVTPKRPTAAAAGRRGRARRISNAFSSMRSPTGRNSRDVPPALGFLVGNPEDAEEAGRKGIFDDDEEEDGGSEVRTPEADDKDDEVNNYVEIQRMEAIQAALTSIMERDARSRHHSSKEADRRHSVESFTARRSVSSLSVSQDEQRTLFDPLGAARQSFDIDDGHLAPRPILAPRASLGQSSPGTGTGTSPTDQTRRRERVFDDDDDEGDEESLAGSVDLASPSLSSRKLSAGVFDGSQDMSARIDPGNTEIGAEIEWMTTRLAHLREQDAILDKMIRAADLKGSTGQLRLLVTSQNDLKLEIQALSLQKQQYQQLQQNSTIHPHRTSIKIPTAKILAQEAGKQIVRYRIDVEQRADDGSTLIHWSVPRRFNEFYDLHQTLKADSRLASVLRARHIEMPAKKLLPKLSEAFVNSRRVALERYLLDLLEVPLACEHIALRRFLSQSTAAFNRKSTSKRISVAPNANDANPVQSFYQSFTTSVDDVFTRPSMLEVVSENLGKQAGDMVGRWDASVAQAGQLGLDWGSAMLSPVLSPIVAGLGDTAYPFGTILGTPEGNNSTKSDSQSTFIGPICDFLMQLLDYKDNDWLRRPALLLILQHFMGSTIERKIRESCESALSAQATENYIKMLQDTMWPNGERRPPSEHRSEDQKLRTKNSAESKIQALIPSACFSHAIVIVRLIVLES